jgi:hypothetical protein
MGKSPKFKLIQVTRALRRSKQLPAELLDEWRDAPWLRQEKERVRDARRAPGARKLPAVSPQAIPVRVDRFPAFAFFPATIEDMQETLGRLPDGVLNGLLEIRVQHEAGPSAGWERGSKGVSAEYWDDVLVPLLRGTYTKRSACIRLYTTVILGRRPEELPRSVCRRLKTMALSTLAHEVAHHFHYQWRMGRGHGLIAPDSGFEEYAKEMQAKWTRGVVVPYVKSLPPEGLRAMIVGTHGPASPAPSRALRTHLAAQRRRR